MAVLDELERRLEEVEARITETTGRWFSGNRLRQLEAEAERLRQEIAAQRRRHELRAEAQGILAPDPVLLFQRGVEHLDTIEVIRTQDPRMPDAWGMIIMMAKEAQKMFAYALLRGTLDPRLQASTYYNLGVAYDLEAQLATKFEFRRALHAYRKASAMGHERAEAKIKAVLQDLDALGWDYDDQDSIPEALRNHFAALRNEYQQGD